MPQIFHHSTNALAKITIYGALFIIVAALWVAVELNRSSWNTGQWVERQQPVQFSHKHHVGDDGIDCRYCHTSVETSRSEEHTSELQSQSNLVCRLLLEK